MASSEELTSQAQALNDLVNKVGAEVGMENKAVGVAVQSAVSKKRRPLPVITGHAAGIESEGKKAKLVTAGHV